MKFIRKIRNGLFGFSILLIALGVFLIVAPTASTRIICYIFGGLIIACGLIDLINYTCNRKQRKYFRFDLLKGIILLSLGLFIVIKPDFVAAILPTVFGLVLIFDGIAKALSAFDLRTEGRKTWISLLILGFLLCGFGVIIALNPFTLVNFSMVIIGIALICDGISNLWCTLCLKKHLEKQ